MLDPNLTPTGAIELTKQIQGISGQSQDGIPGPKTRSAVSTIFSTALSTVAVTAVPVQSGGNVLVGDGTWPYTVSISGNDLVMSGIATCWGGPTDPDDEGTTACGFSTLKEPSLKAVSLAMVADSTALRGSPVPHMPFGIIFRNGEWVDNPAGAHVIVTVNGKDYGPWPVIDEGPGFVAPGNPPYDKKPRVVDITTIGALEIDPDAGPNNFEVQCSVRIINGVNIAATPLV